MEKEVEWWPAGESAVLPRSPRRKETGMNAGAVSGGWGYGNGEDMAGHTGLPLRPTATAEK